LRRQAWGRLFGLAIRAARTEAGLSIEEAAGLSGMELSEWMAIEEGYVPREVDRLRAMSAALEVSFEKLFNMVLLCREAWEL
jgi:transcriptional regulator with XRE-family HTH domain